MRRLKLSANLDSQLVRVAKNVGRTPESLAIAILARELPREAAMADFVRAALASDMKSEAGAPTYRAEDVNA